MGCFLGCFGSSKDEKKRPRNTHNVNLSSHPTPNALKQYNAIQQPVAAAKQDYIEKPINFPVPEPRAKPEELLSLTDQVKQEEQLSSGTRKRVTFNSNVKEYEHVSISDVSEIIQENEKGAVQGVGAGCLRPGESSSVSESGSTLSSLVSFPPNHRYQNCTVSDDEDEELDCVVSDLDEDEDEHSDDDEEAYDAEYSDDEYYSRQVPEFSTRSCSSMESGTKSVRTPVASGRHDDEIKDHESVDNKEEKTPPGFYRGARDRSGYVHSVLNPIENTAQWKNVKSKQIPPLQQPKENFQPDLGSKQLSLASKAKVDEPENHGFAVDASLSTWLISSQKTPRTKASTIGLEPISSGGSVSSHGSNSVRSQEERPILGAWTTEELKQFSASSSPRRSPSRSQDEKPLVGTVGVHWNNRNEMTPVNSGSASSFKGIPNTTSKYREDKSVKWHSTPFETRLERALNRRDADSRT